MTPEYPQRTYAHTLADLALIQELLPIPPLKHALLQNIEVLLPEALLIAGDPGGDESLATLIDRLENFLGLGLARVGSGVETARKKMPQHLAFRHFLERHFLIETAADYRRSAQIREDIAALSLLWLLYDAEVLQFRNFSKNSIICEQGARELSIIFNLAPIDIYDHGRRIYTVPAGNIIGEGGILGVPRSAEMRIAATSEKDAWLAIINCERLRENMFALFESLRVEVFISFLEKLQHANSRRQENMRQLRQRQISFRDLLKKSPPDVITSSALAIMQQSGLLSGLSMPGKEEALKRYIQKIVRNEQAEPGETIIALGAPPEKIFVLASGKISIRGGNGEILGYVLAGEVIGESIITGTPTIAQVVAEDHCQLVSLYQRDIAESPLKKLFFVNCFKLLQKKLTESNQVNIELEKLLQAAQRPAMPASASEHPGHIIPTEKSEKKISPIRSNPIGRSRPIDPRLGPGRSETEETSAIAPFRKFRDLIRSSLRSWLGEDISEKDGRELQAYLDRFQTRVESGDISITPQNRKK
jgi:CRP-like cAMP-binding protein